MYRKAFEAAFFVSFLFLYYAVLVERKPTGIGIFETLMYVWIAAFAYDELSGMVDAGMLFYQMDFWSLWDMGIIAIGLVFVIARESFAPVAIPWPAPAKATSMHRFFLRLLTDLGSQVSLDWPKVAIILRIYHSTYCHWKLCFWFQGKASATIDY